MIRRLRIRNFQSVVSADINLDKFTVIVGPSNSGKSALLRAARLVFTNSNTSDFVTRGHKNAGVSIHTDEHEVGITRGPSFSEYVLAYLNTGEIAPFTKTGTTVPEEVAQALRLDPELSYASQFDKPYLVDEGSTTIAKVLGRLTNMATIMDAVRIGRSTSTRAKNELTIRQKDLEICKEQIKKFSDLKPKKELQASLEAVLAKAEETEGNLALLEFYVRNIETAKAILAKAPREISLPDLGELETKRAMILDLSSTIGAANFERLRMAQLDEQIASSDEALLSLRDLEHEILQELGICPTCGQSTEHLTTSTSS